MGPHFFHFKDASTDPRLAALLGQYTLIRYSKSYIHPRSSIGESVSLRPLHICFICSEYPPAPHGGIGSFTQVLGRSLVNRGHRVTALGMYLDQFVGSGRDNDQGVDIIRISRRGLPLIRPLVNRRRQARAIEELHTRHPIDIIEGGELDIATLPQKTPGLKLIRMHGGPTFFSADNHIMTAKERWAFHIADELCAVSQTIADGTRKLLNLGSRHIEVIHNPIDTRLFAPKPDDLAEQEGLIVFAGSITERKGIRQLIQAMPKIVAAVPEAHLEVYGGEAFDPPPPVPLAEVLKGLLPPEVAPHVIWKGRVPRSELPRAIQRASVCVYPSFIEAMPIAWIEGMASGKAVVASKTGPGPELIDDGLNGLLCDPSSPDSIADALIRVLKDREFRQRLGANARKTAQERWELESIISKNEAYYRRLTHTT